MAGRFVYEWIDAWMDECMDAWMHGWMDGWMHGCMDGWPRMRVCLNLVNNIVADGFAGTTAHHGVREASMHSVSLI